MILSFFRKDPVNETARAIYDSLVEAARRPEFFTDFGVADDVEGRFEVLTLHVFLALRRLKGEGPEAERLSQKVFDAFFRNMDDSLREMGVGDMSIGRKIRGLAESFYGRVGAYEKAMSDESASSHPALIAALSRNVYGLEAAAEAGPLADYLVTADQTLAGQPLEHFMQGRPVAFPPVDAGSDDGQNQ